MDKPLNGPRIPDRSDAVNSVDGEPSKVKDIPTSGTSTRLGHGANRDDIGRNERRQLLGKTALHFGKFKGKKLKDVPIGYLKWIAAQAAMDKRFRKVQRKVREYLGMPPAPSKKNKARQQKLPFDNDLDREYFAIIGAPEPARNGSSGRASQRPSNDADSSPRAPAPGKKLTPKRKRTAGRRTVHVACTRCPFEDRMDKVAFGYESRRAAKCRCPLCGGNVVRYRYVHRDGREK